MPDRPFFMRHRTTSVAEINGYTNVSRSGPSKQGAFLHVARGHAYLATRRPWLALLDYDAALKLKPDQTHLFVAKGEALLALGRPAEALQALDRAVADRPQDADALGSRAVVLLALGRIAEADADWVRQLELLPRERHDARACVWLRLANYEMALHELEPAVGRSAADPYLQLYYLTAARRLRVARPTGVFRDGCLARSSDPLFTTGSSAQTRHCSGPTRRSVAPKLCSSLGFVLSAVTATRPADRGGRSSRVPVRTRSSMPPRDTRSRRLARSRRSSALRRRHSGE